MGVRMVFILGAISFHHALRILILPLPKRAKETCFIKPGLNLNFNAKETQKTIQFYMHHFLSSRIDLVIWHDSINNSTSKQSSKINRILSTELLAYLFIRYKQKLVQPFTTNEAVLRIV